MIGTCLGTYLGTYHNLKRLTKRFETLRDRGDDGTLNIPLTARLILRTSLKLTTYKVAFCYMYEHYLSSQHNLFDVIAEGLLDFIFGHSRIYTISLARASI